MKPKHDTQLHKNKNQENTYLRHQTSALWILLSVIIITQLNWNWKASRNCYL